MKKHWFKILTITYFVLGSIYMYKEFYSQLINKAEFLITVTLYLVGPWLMIWGIKSKKPKVLFGNFRNIYRSFLIPYNIFFLYVSLTLATKGNLIFSIILCWKVYLGFLIITIPGWYYVLRKKSSALIGLVPIPIGIILIYLGCIPFT